MWDIFSAGFWPKDFFTGAKWTDVLLTLFTLGLVLVGWRQAKISKKQTEIANQTRDIAVAGLGRPYIMVNTVSHNHGDWRAGQRQLTFQFDFRNFGSVPGIIKGVYAEVLLSDGLSDDSTEAQWPAKRFPDARAVQVYAMPGRAPTCSFPAARVDRRHESENSWILRADATSGFFGQDMQLHYPSARSPNYLFKKDFSARPLEPEPAPPDPDARKCAAFSWLLGTVIYENILGGLHYTAFCYRGGGGGTANEIYDEPYNKRT